MTKTRYKEQVRLLLRILPHVAAEESFALKGGTAINLFVRDLPRLSVDIDLTYVPIEERDVSLKSISETLDRIRNRALPLQFLASRFPLHRKQGTRQNLPAC